jgi:hypothetical protein
MEVAAWVGERWNVLGELEAENEFGRVVWKIGGGYVEVEAQREMDEFWWEKALVWVGPYR